MNQQLDLLEGLNGPCGDCRHLDPVPIQTGLRYCVETCMWRWPTERPDCRYRAPAMPPAPDPQA